MKNPFVWLAGAVLLVIPGRAGTASAATVHSYNASSAGNTAAVWVDSVAGRNWTFGNTLLLSPLAVPSAAAGISAAYSRDQTASAVVTGTAASFAYTDVTVETWVRPSALNADHQIIFESGGGQNGAAILISSAGVRFLGSAGNTRTVDHSVPFDGLALSDFLQISYVITGAADTFDVYVRDVNGILASGSLTGVNVVHGGNAASLFRMTGADVNLGGRTEAVGSSPAGLRPFDGEIARVNVYNHALTSAELEISFNNVLLGIPEPASGLLGMAGLAVMGLRRRRKAGC